MFKTVSIVEADTLPKRKGWLRLAWTKAPPAAKLPTKDEFVENPVKTIPSEIVGYKLASAYVCAEPNEWLQPVSHRHPAACITWVSYPTCVTLLKV